MRTFLRLFAALALVGAMASATLAISAIGAGVRSAGSSHSARPATTLIAAAATNPSPNGTLYDY